MWLAGTTGFEPATSGLTGRRTLQTVLRSLELPGTSGECEVYPRWPSAQGGPVSFPFLLVRVWRWYEYQGQDRRPTSIARNGEVLLDERRGSGLLSEEHGTRRQSHHVDGGVGQGGRGGVDVRDAEPQESFDIHNPALVEVSDGVAALTYNAIGRRKADRDAYRANILSVLQGSPRRLAAGSPPADAH